ncbi:MAG: ATP-binding protein [Bacilli bacterium]
MKKVELYEQRNRRMLAFYHFGIGLFIAIGLVASSIFYTLPALFWIIKSLVVCLILIASYYCYKTNKLFWKITQITILSLYLYGDFLIYSDTASMYTVLCVIPIFSVMHGNKRLFFINWSINIILGYGTIVYILSQTESNRFQYLKADPIGNSLIFFFVQTTILFFYLFVDFRMKMMQNYQEQLQRSAHLETFGRLAASLAHEIRNPLTVMKGFVQLAQFQDTSKSEQQNYLNTVTNEIEYAETIINDYLMLTRMQDVRRSAFTHLNEEVVRSIHLVSYYGNSQGVTVRLENIDECYATINPVEFKQVLVNLVKNAIEAMNNTGEVVVRIQSVNDFAAISVIDNGIGMTKETLSKIGTLFFSRKQNGNGVGLALCFEIAEKYGGSIDVQSEIGYGSTFIVKLPLAEQERKDI